MSSDLDFFPELQADWRRVPLKGVCDYRVSSVDKVPSEDEQPVRLCNYVDVYHNEFITPNLELMKATATEAEVDRFGLRVGDVIITKDSESWDDIGVPAVIADSAPDIVCGYHLAMLRPTPGVLDGRYLFRCLQARPMQYQFERAVSGVTRYGLGLDTIGRLMLPLPPLAVQKAVADYLDRETQTIDAMIAAKERLLKLLAEKRRTLITHAVTRGLNPDAPMRDSGVKWLGEIPEHWRLWKLGHLAQVGNGSTPKRDNLSYWSNGTIPWLNSSVVNHDVVPPAEFFVTDQAIKECHLPLVRPNSVLIGITGQGKTRGMAVLLGYPSTINQHMAFISPDLKRLDPTYLRSLLDACYSYLRNISDGSGGTKGALTCEAVSKLRIPLPPLDEQQAIVRRIESLSTAIDRLAKAARCSWDLLTERRSALISSAVTGATEVPYA